MQLLSRDKFRESVFKRDGHKCVICKKEAKDAHHILERRLFPDGGYYVENGASLCEEHHLMAEMTVLSVEEVREAAGIKIPALPPHLYPDQIYDKWGNPVQPDGSRLRGELFFDLSVQKILREGGVLDLFSNRVRYPRTYHLPFSPGITNDDRALKDCLCFEGKEVVVTEKLDGESASLYPDFYHARSPEGNPHPSRDWVKRLHSEICGDIPADWRICGENLYAKHTIHYKKLESYFYLISIWNETNVCLSWDETVEWATLLGLTTVPVLYRGVFDEKLTRGLFKPVKDNGDEMEGFVVRLADAFPYANFRQSVAKFVRQGHVQQGHGHWMRSKLILNEVEDKNRKV